MNRGLLTLWVISLCCAGWAGELTLSELKAKMKERGATWQAGETSVSKFSAAEKKQLLGAKLEDGFGDYFKSAKPERSDVRLPAKFDWRNKDGVNYASPVLNQAHCGSCVAFAAVSTMETQMNITRNTPNSPWAFSPQHLFSCGGGGCESGWTPFAALAFLKDNGVPDEACYPYQSGGNGKDLACTQTCSDSASRTVKISNYGITSFFFMNETMVKQAIMKGPLLATMVVYEDFLFYKSGVYKHVTGAQAGGHAISIVGWDDADKAWIVRNSWSPSWGEEGYFRIAMDDASGVGTQTFSMEVPTAAGFVTLGGLRDNKVFQGQINLTMESTFPGTTAVDFVMNKKGRPVYWGGGANGARVAIDSTLFEDGEYTIVAQANHSGGTSQSQPRKVFILNKEEKGSISLLNLKDGDVVKDKVELQIKTEAAPVPFTQVQFRATNTATGELTVRTSNVVLPEMLMLWRAQILPVGDYMVELEASIDNLYSVKTQPIKVKVSR